MGRHAILIGDDDFSIVKLFDVLARITNRKTKKDVILDGMLCLAEKYKLKLTKLDLDLMNEISYELNRNSNRKESRSIYQSRNAIMILIEMISKGIDYNAIDEKRKTLLSQLNFNRFNPLHKKILQKMKHADYNNLRRKIEYIKVSKGFTFGQIKTLGYEGIVKFDDSEKRKIINITPKKSKKVIRK